MAMDCTQLYRGWRITVRMQGHYWLAYGGTRFTRESREFVFEPIGIGRDFDQAMTAAQQCIDNKYNADAEHVLEQTQRRARALGERIGNLRMAAFMGEPPSFPRPPSPPTSEGEDSGPLFT